MAALELQTGHALSQPIIHLEAGMPCAARHGIPPAKKIVFFFVYSGLPKGHDQKDNIFYAYDNKIMKLTPEGTNELFLDGGQSSPTLKAIVGIEFATDYRHLFACDGKLGSGKLVKIPIRSDGSPGPVELLYHDENLNTEYIAFDKDFNLIIKGPWSQSFIRVDKNGKAEPLKHADIGYGIQTITRGGQGFDQNAIYGTHMPFGVIYKIVLP